MIKFFKLIVDNYYWIFVLSALWTYIGLPDLYSLIIILYIMATIVFLNERPINWNVIDVLVVIYILYQLCSYIFSAYSFSLYYYGIKAQIMPMAFYFIGRNVLVADKYFLERMKWPMMFAFLVGLILYFWSPDWYIARRTSFLMSDSSRAMFHEATRLSSFWPWSYAMGYGSLYFILYFTKDILRGKSDKIMFACLMVAILVLFFAQQRVSLAFFALYVFFISIYGNFSKKHIITLWIFVGVIICALAIWMLEYANASYLNYVLNRSINSKDSIVGERFGLFESFWKVSALGEGLGKYGHAALMYKKPSITDCEYIRLMAELGVVGYVLFFLIYIKLLLKAFSLRRMLLFECCVLLFFLFSMIGATPLENTSMQPFLLWYCMGRINAITSVYNIAVKRLSSPTFK